MLKKMYRRFFYTSQKGKKISNHLVKEYFNKTGELNFSQKSSTEEEKIISKYLSSFRNSKK